MNRFAIENAFIDSATAGRLRELCTFYNQHNLFRKSKFWRDVELQNTHIVLLKSPRHVMQVSTLSAQLGLGSELASWYRGATSVPHGQLLTDSSLRTDDRLCYFTKHRILSLKLLYTGTTEPV